MTGIVEGGLAPSSRARSNLLKTAGENDVRQPFNKVYVVGQSIK